MVFKLYYFVGLSISMVSGNSIYQFLQRCLEVLRREFSELKTVTADQLMYVKEDLILPHHYTFYDFIVTKVFFFFLKCLQNHNIIVSSSMLSALYQTIWFFNVIKVKNNFFIYRHVAKAVLFSCLMHMMI